MIPSDAEYLLDYNPFLHVELDPVLPLTTITLPVGFWIPICQILRAIIILTTQDQQWKKSYNLTTFKWNFQVAWFYTKLICFFYAKSLVSKNAHKSLKKVLLIPTYKYFSDVYLFIWLVFHAIFQEFLIIQWQAAFRFEEIRHSPVKTHDHDTNWSTKAPVLIRFWSNFSKKKITLKWLY